MTTSIAIHNITDVETTLQDHHEGSPNEFTTLTVNAKNKDGEKYSICFFLSDDLAQKLPVRATTKLLDFLITGKV